MISLMSPHSVAVLLLQHRPGQLLTYGAQLFCVKSVHDCG